jgi:N-methylhydantoinase A
MKLEQRLDARYAGQAYELNVPAEGDYVAAFHQAHEQRYGYQNAERKLEIVNVRCRATGITRKNANVKIAARRRGQPGPVAQTVPMVFEGRERNAKLFAREELCAGDRIAGPAVVMEYSATTLIAPAWEAVVESYGQLILTRKS